MKYKTPLRLAAAICVLTAIPALAQTVVSKTVTTEQTPPASGKIINLNNFDLNKDGLLSTYEVGEMLFRTFDTDASNALDPSEYEFKAVITVAPMEKTTTLSYDYNNDGAADTTQYTYEKFSQDTQLTRFDKNRDGLSAHEFVNKPFSAVDTDQNGSIDLAEWRAAYMSIIPPLAP